MKPLDKTISSHLFFRIWNPIVVVVSIFILVSLTLETLYTLNKDTYRLLFNLELVVSAVYIADFALSCYYSVDKKRFFRKEWVYLMISLPYVHLIYWFSLAPTAEMLFFLQLVRLLRSAKGLTIIVKRLTIKKVNTILGTYSLYLATTLYFCSLAFYSFEHGVNPTVHSYFDAVWWSIVTVTTVGYGDIAPVTVSGRIIAIILILGGMGLFSTITAYLSSRFLDMHRQKIVSNNEFTGDDSKTSSTS